MSDCRQLCSITTSCLQLPIDWRYLSQCWNRVFLVTDQLFWSGRVGSGHGSRVSVADPVSVSCRCRQNNPPIQSTDTQWPGRVTGSKATGSGRVTGRKFRPGSISDLSRLMRDMIRVACTRNLSAVLTLCHLERLFIIGAATYGVHYSVSMSLKWCGMVWYSRVYVCMAACLCGVGGCVQRKPLIITTWNLAQ